MRGNELCIAEHSVLLSGAGLPGATFLQNPLEHSQFIIITCLENHEDCR
jgi:hypothetical protein